MVPSVPRAMMPPPPFSTGRDPDVGDTGSGEEAARSGGVSSSVAEVSGDR